MIINLRRIAVCIVFCWFFVCAAYGQNLTARENCFAFEKLPGEQRKKAEELLLKALDSEALYTIAGNLKPMSSGFQSFQIQVQLSRLEPAEAEKTVRELGAKRTDELSASEKSRLSQAKSAAQRQAALDQINETRRIFDEWRCGENELFADVHHFARAYEGKRHLDAVVFARPALRKMLAEKSDFFSRWGVTMNSHPLEALYAVDRDETSARFAGYGYLFGYPDAAVRFFVESAFNEELTGRFVERDFLSIPTIKSEKNGFVYAVPKAYTESDADKTLRTQAMRIFTSYQRRRAAYIGEGKKGVVELVRDWFCAAGKCSPQNAALD